MRLQSNDTTQDCFVHYRLFYSNPPHQSIRLYPKVQWKHRQIARGFNLAWRGPMKVELGFRKTRSGFQSFAQQGRLVTVFESQGWKGIRMDGRENEQAKRQDVVGST